LLDKIIGLFILDWDLILKYFTRSTARDPAFEGGEEGAAQGEP
jgi:hypothetical protein